MSVDLPKCRFSLLADPHHASQSRTQKQCTPGSILSANSCCNVRNAKNIALVSIRNAWLCSAETKSRTDVKQDLKQALNKEFKQVPKLEFTPYLDADGKFGDKVDFGATPFGFESWDALVKSLHTDEKQRAKLDSVRDQVCTALRNGLSDVKVG